MSSKNQTWQAETKMIAILPLTYNNLKAKLLLYHSLLNENALPVSLITIVFELKKHLENIMLIIVFFLYNSKCS